MATNPMPASDTATAWVIFLHGLGDSGQGWAHLGQQLSRRLPWIAWSFPDAAQSAVTCNGGSCMPSWFDIQRIPVAESEPLRPRGLDAAVSAVHAMLRQTESMGYDPSRVALAGFSQGGALALEAARRYPHKLGGVVSMSGWLPNGRHSKRQATPPSQRLRRPSKPVRRRL